MCGIAGWAFAPPDEPRLRRALAALAHRGPDGEGGWSSHRASLGHRRLAIIDLSNRARQPMGNDDGSVQVSFNGEIYNFKALRAALEKNHCFRSDSDTEVLVHAYEEWGIDGLLDRITGMFAFALWDERLGRLHLVRDRFGKKPLYFTVPDGSLRFASTLPALLELLRSTPPLRPDALADYLHYLCVPGDKSILEGVHKLRPAHRATYDGERLEFHRYWRLSFAGQERRRDEEWLAVIDTELRRATTERLVADVPVGVFLSGGVDSSLVTAAAVEASSGRVTTISAGFDDRASDELRWARLVAERLGTEHHEHVIRPDSAADLPWLVYAAGEPLADPALLPTMYLARAARAHVTVILTGDGGDEAFAGYASSLIGRVAPVYEGVVPGLWRRSLVPQALQWVAQQPAPVGGLARKLRRLAEAARADFVWHHDNLSEKSFRGRAADILHPRIVAQLTGYDPDQLWDAAYAETDGPTCADRVLHLELVTQLPDLFLTKTDAASMAHSLEARSPFLDARLIELSARIPAAAKTRRLRSKALLKRLALLKGLPRPAILRAKHGFSVPVSAWLRGPLAGISQELLIQGLGRREIIDPPCLRRLLSEHRAGADHGQRLWSLLILELWLRMFLDHTLSPRDTLADGTKHPRVSMTSESSRPPTLASRTTATYGSI